MELQRDQQNFQNMSRSQTCKSWVQFSRTHSNAQDEIVTFSAVTQKEENAGPHHQDEKDWEK